MTRRRAVGYETPLRAPFDAPLRTYAFALDLARPLRFGRVAGHSLATALRGAFDRALLTSGCAALPEGACPRDGAPCARPASCVIPWLIKPAAAAQRRTHPSPVVLQAAASPDDPRRVALAVALFGGHAVDAAEHALAALHLAAAWGVRDDEGAVRFALRGGDADARTLGERVASLRGEAPAGALWALEFVDPCAAEAPELAALAGNAAHDLVQWDLHDRGLDDPLGKRGCDALADLARAAALDAWGAVEVTVESLSADTWGPRRSRSNAGRFALEGFRGRVTLTGAVREALPWVLPWTLRASADGPPGAWAPSASPGRRRSLVTGPARACDSAPRAMGRHFNTAGPCRPEIHYTLPTMGRLPEVRALVESQSYFGLHAPRQVGKTTALLSFAETLTAEGRFAAVFASLEAASVFDEVGAVELAALAALRESAEVRLPRDLWPPPWPEADPGARVRAGLRAWAEVSPRPLVVFLDEVDALGGAALLSVLCQLRDGHTLRPRSFPWALALIGMRDVRDYRVAPGEPERTRSASPFNIKSDSLTLRAFTAAEVSSLYAQHTAETGQPFEAAAVARAFELTRGQPWLVNALARQCVEAVVTDRARPVTARDVDLARDRLILRQDTHLDSLAERLREPRVRRVIGPMLTGGALGEVADDDRRYVLDLGLVRRSDEGGLEVANPIYREVVVRALAQGIQDGLPQIRATWLRADGALDPDRLLAAFLDFWREHGESLLGGAPYAEAAAQLVLMAFLHRVVNGGGTVAREYAIGRGRIDLCVTLGGARLAMELKAWRSGQRDPAPKGLAQLDAYLEGVGLATGWLVVFDQRARRPPPSKRIRAAKAKTPAGRAVTLVRL